MGHFYHLGTRGHVEDEMEFWSGELTSKYGRPYTWDIVIGAPEAVVDTALEEIRIGIEEARRYFSEAFAPLVRVFAHWHLALESKTYGDKVVECAPPGSKAWTNLLRLCNHFAFQDYMRVRDLLSQPVGKDAVVSIWYGDGLFYDTRSEKTRPEKLEEMMAQVAHRNALLRSLSLESLVDIPFTDWETRHDREDVLGAYRWAVGYLDEQASQSLTLYLLDKELDDVWDEWGEFDAGFDTMRYFLRQS